MALFKAALIVSAALIVLGQVVYAVLHRACQSLKRWACDPPTSNGLEQRVRWRRIKIVQECAAGSAVQGQLRSALY